MPMRLGGSGLRSAAQMAPAAFWAPNVCQKSPIGSQMNQLWHQSNWTDMVSWIDLVGQICNVEPAHPLLFQWTQESGNTAGNITSSPSEYHFWETVMFAQSCSFALAFGSRCRRRVPRFSNPPRVRGPARTLPNADLGDVSLFTSLMLNASAVPRSTEWDVTEQRAHVQVV